MNIKTILEKSLASIQSCERNFICVALQQHCGDDEQLYQKCVKVMEKYKPKGKNEYIGWWAFFDRKSRIAALEKAIGELE